jgi:DNA-binding LytR/AlgR family response regulator
MVGRKKLKDRFLVRLGNHIHSIKVEDIALFYAEGRTVYLVTTENKKFILDYKLEDLCELLETSLFYRVNRTFIVNINTIQDVVVYSSNRLKITPKTRVDKEIIVSREKVSSFKKWFEGN